VDDIILAAPFDRIQEILNIFNSLHTGILFMTEISNCRRINFLDTIIIIENQKIIFDIKRQLSLTDSLVFIRITLFAINCLWYDMTE